MSDFEPVTARTACPFGNHGMIARGPNLTRAVHQAHRLEIMCRQYVLVRQLGEPNRLTDADWEDFFKRVEDNGIRQERLTHGARGERNLAMQSRA